MLYKGYVPLLGPLASAHAHRSTVRWDALSCLPPLRRGVKPCWARCGLASVHPTASFTPFTRLQLRHCLHMAGVLYRVGVAQLPGPIQACKHRMLPAQCTRRSKYANCTFGTSWAPATQAVCCGAHARVWRRIRYVHTNGSGVDEVCVLLGQYRLYFQRRAVGFKDETVSAKC